MKAFIDIDKGMCIIRECTVFRTSEFARQKLYENVEIKFEGDKIEVYGSRLLGGYNWSDSYCYPSITVDTINNGKIEVNEIDLKNIYDKEFLSTVMDEFIVKETTVKMHLFKSDETIVKNKLKEGQFLLKTSAPFKKILTTNNYTIFWKI